MPTKLKITIDDPPNGERIFYPGMILSGRLDVTSTKVHKDYHCIKVSLCSKAYVQITCRGYQDPNKPNDPYAYKTTVPDSLSSFSGGSNTSTDQKTIMNTSVTVWEREDPGDHYPPGDFVYHFKFTLDGSSMPPSYGDERGRIIYKISCAILNKKAKGLECCKKHFTFMNVVDASEPHLMQPATMEESRTVSRMLSVFRMSFIPGGLINLKATIPRTGYSINDTVPVEVFVDNGSGREIRRVFASLHRTAKYKSSSNSYDFDYRISTAISYPVAPHSTVTWEPPPLLVPPMITTVTGEDLIVQILYTIRVTAVIERAKDLVVDVPIVVGNVPPTPSPS